MKKFDNNLLVLYGTIGIYFGIVYGATVYNPTHFVSVLITIVATLGTISLVDLTIHVKVNKVRKEALSGKVHKVVQERQRKNAKKKQIKITLPQKK